MPLLMVADGIGIHHLHASFHVKHSNHSDLIFTGWISCPVQAAGKIERLESYVDAPRIHYGKRIFDQCALIGEYCWEQGGLLHGYPPGQLI